jgi:hypothetical protein
MLVFLERNGISIRTTDEELVKLGLGLANGTITDKEVLPWNIDHNEYGIGLPFSFLQKEVFLWFRQGSL